MTPTAALPPLWGEVWHLKGEQRGNHGRVGYEGMKGGSGSMGSWESVLGSWLNKNGPLV